MPGPFARLITVLSLLTCLAIATLWVIGLSTGVTLRISTEAFERDARAPNEERHVVTNWYLQSGDSGLAVARLRLDGPGAVLRMHGFTQTPPAKVDWLRRRPPIDPADLWTLKRPAADSGWEWRRGPFFARRQRRQTVWTPDARDGPPFVKQAEETAAGLPAAIPVALFAILPFRAALRAHRRSKWVEQGRCWQCGYDVRATPARCPECGATPRVKPRKGVTTSPAAATDISADLR